MSAVLRAEWTTQRTVASAGWPLAGAVALIVALSVAVVLATTYTTGDPS